MATLDQEREAITKAMMGLLACTTPADNHVTGELDSDAHLINFDNGVDNRKRQQNLCLVILESVQKAQTLATSEHSKRIMLSETEERIETPNNSFIRTTIGRYSSANATSLATPTKIGPGIRDVLGNVSSSTTAKLAQALSSLLTDRVSRASLLPATQDERANMEAMVSSSKTKAAQTISALGMNAARLYAELIGMPGAWGSGLIDVGTVSGLSALVRRWCLECRGRASIDDEDSVTEKTVGQNKRKRQNKKSKKKKRSRKPGTRKSSRLVATISSDSEDSESDLELNNDLTDEIILVEEASYVSEEDMQLSEIELIKNGLKLAIALARVPTQKDFMSWSSEAREALIDAVTCALACASSIRLSHDGSELPNESIGFLCTSAISLISKSLQKCVCSNTSTASNFSMSGIKSASRRSLSNSSSMHPRTPGSAISLRDEIQDNDSLEKYGERRNETAVFILRGLLPILLMQLELPNGQRGKMSAQKAASETLESITECLSIGIDSEDKSMKRRSQISTPRTPHQAHQQVGTTPSILRTTKGTPRSKKKLSQGNGNDTKQVDFVMTPSLKKATTPKRNGARFSLGYSTEKHDETLEVTSLQPRPILRVVVGMLQRIATSKGLERAESRSLAKGLIQKCLRRLPVLEQSHILRFSMQLCHSKIAVHRLFGVELIGDIIPELWLWKDHYSDDVSSPTSTNTGNITTPTTDSVPLSPSLKDNLSEKNIPLALLKVLHARISDRAPAVRAKAAHSMSETIKQIKSLESIQNGEDGSENSEIMRQQARFKYTLMLIAQPLILSLRKRSSYDERATVRKAAISGWLALLLWSRSEENVPGYLLLSDIDVAILSRLCGDNSVSTRKAAAEALTTLLQYQYMNKASNVTNCLLESAWASSVLPLVLDTETSCVAKALDFFRLIVLDPIIEVGGNPMHEKYENNKYRYMVSWKVLSQMSDGSKDAGSTRGEAGALKAALKKVLDDAGNDQLQLSRPILREIRRVIVSSLDLDESIVSMSLFEDAISAQRTGAWCLLDALTECSTDKSFSIEKAVKASSIDTSFLTLSWKKLHSLSESTDIPSNYVTSIAGTSRACLRVIAKLGSFVPISESEQSAQSLKRILSSFDLTPDLIGAGISALVSLSKRASNVNTPASMRMTCSILINEIYENCEEVLDQFISNRVVYGNASNIERVIFTVGDLSMIGFSSDEDGTNKIKDDTHASDSDPVRGLHERPSKHLIHLIQTMLPPSSLLNGPSGGTEVTPPSIRAHAFIALGKLCLRDEALAKNCLNLLARELHQDAADTNPSVQSNALLVLGDLCVKYTNLVDRYLPVMAACLQSGWNKDQMLDSSFVTGMETSSTVRKNAILLLSSLILQDYIKWRGLLIHRFMVACSDHDESVSNLAETTLCGPLLSKQPNLFFNNFVESLFVLNGCTAHPIYTAAAVSGDGGSGFAVDFGLNLSGQEHAHRRHEIYHMMISHLTDEEKIGITARLSKEVLGGALESMGDLSLACRRNPQPFAPDAQLTSNEQRHKSAFSVVSDAFTILSSSDMRVGKRAHNDDDEEEGESTPTDGPAAAQLAAVKGRLLSKISRKHLIETVVPILCNLKTVLQESRSCLLKDLMRYLVEIFRLYKVEIKELLASDPTLLQELEYDTRQFEKSRQKQPEAFDGEMSTDEPHVISESP